MHKVELTMPTVSRSGMLGSGSSSLCSQPGHGTAAGAAAAAPVQWKMLSKGTAAQPSHSSASTRAAQRTRNVQSVSRGEQALFLSGEEKQQFRVYKKC
ncbi:Keratin, type II cuticular Hb4 [Frankliniella fusca]|uniref:Keratin, type II cuticular Hb4 n=1 Tax=Frankliniella fusca TaxID=407009 RepID=A0AAE1GTH0_9NEOP|nr:Keratin, type II cuticular Hb4 [Frankliniella fusca]